MHEILFSLYKKTIKIFTGSGIGGFYPIRVIDSFIISFLKPNFVEVQKHKMFLDSKDSLRLSIHGIYEPFETEIVKKVVKRDDVILDIGANIGYYSLIFAEIVGDQGRVFAFEPSPANFALLSKNIEINNYKNVTLVQEAVSNKTGKGKLYLCEDNQGDHRIYDSYDGRRSISIETTRLDDYFKNYDGKVDFIKMDIQGAEGGAIQGALSLLRKNKNLKIITELWPVGLKRCGIDVKEYLKLLIGQGFTLYQINKQDKKIELINTSKILEAYIPKKGNHTSLLCVK